MEVIEKQKIKSSSASVIKSRQKPKTSQSKRQTKYKTRFENLVKDIAAYTQDPKDDLLLKAFHFASEAHKDQLRKSGYPFIEHCLETAGILVKLRMDPITVAAGLIHDVVEDTEISIAEVEDEFGKEIAQLVDGVTKISELKIRSDAEKQAENFRKMIFSMAQDLRVILIKLADRLHNMRTLEFLPKEKAERIALETREVYAPLAHRFGIARMKWELEDLSLKTLNPDVYKEIEKKVAERREERESYIRKLIRPVKQELEKNGIQAEVRGRAKSIYSIYRKIEKRKVPFEEIFDLFAIRIIVDRLDACYSALGIVHTLFNPVHERFKDYIATPKLNMYQSLHTSIVGPDGKIVEIQVRTEEMHRVAEIGIAAHWKYKEQRLTEDGLDRYSSWLREIIDWQKDTLDPEEYMDILKTDLFLTEIFVFTPKGDLLKLPNGSTPVDFAFTVHTDIGEHCIGAKVNGRIVPLNTKLCSGDSIEIITSSNQRPNRDWLIFVQTSKAKSKIRKWLKEAQFEEAVQLGEEILSKGMKRHKIRYTKEQLKTFAAQRKTTLNKLYADLGEGVLSIHKILSEIAPEKVQPQSEQKKENLFEKFVSKARGSAKGVRVQGMDNLLIRFAKCCHPVPGDPIVGFISKGRGITIHRSDCDNALKLMETPERNIDVSWDVDRDEAFMVQLRIMATERGDFLKDMVESVSAMKTNIIKIDMNTENALITAFTILEVKDLSHLTKIMRRLYRIRGVLSVERGSPVDKLSDER